MGEGKRSHKDEVHLKYNLSLVPWTVSGSGNGCPAWERRAGGGGVPAASATGGQSELPSHMGYSGREGKENLVGWESCGRKDWKGTVSYDLEGSEARARS